MLRDPENQKNPYARYRRQSLANFKEDAAPLAA
jgi:hypothetical protein